MRIGVFRVSVQGEKENSKGYYNAQFLGLSKELDKQCDEVIVYEHILKGQTESVEAISGCKHATLHKIAVKNIGVNGIADTSRLDPSIDVLVLFSDIQLAVPKIYRWAKKNNIIVLPYIGVLESHSVNAINRVLMKIAVKRNLKVYRKCHCLAKTPNIELLLIRAGVKNISLMPAGLDLSLLKEDYLTFSKDKCANDFGFSVDNKLILFVGRLTEEKQPLRMIDIFREVYNIDSRFRLCMIGKGELKAQMLEKISKLGLTKQVRLIDSVPNCDMWKLYRITDCFVNLNQQEIFGMSILEAMYYGCKVVAWHAPGPDFIIENKANGILCDSNEEVIKGIVEAFDHSIEAKERIVNNFTWRVTSKAVLAAVQSQKIMG